MVLVKPPFVSLVVWSVECDEYYAEPDFEWWVAHDVDVTVDQGGWVLSCPGCQTMVQWAIFLTRVETRSSSAL